MSSSSTPTENGGALPEMLLDHARQSLDPIASARGSAEGAEWLPRGAPWWAGLTSGEGRLPTELDLSLAGSVPR